MNTAKYAEEWKIKKTEKIEIVLNRGIGEFYMFLK